MTFKRAIGKANTAQQARQDRCRELGCIACIMFVVPQPLASEIHHQTQNGRQLGHDQTVCLCSWHHRAICVPGVSRSEMEREYGPSLHRPAKFFYTFGSNAEQLEFQNQLAGITDAVAQVQAKIPLPRRYG